MPEIPEAIDLQCKLKSLIISQARIIHGPTNPSAHTFDVILDEPEDKSGVVAGLVVYTRPNSFGDWKILRIGVIPHASGCTAMQSLLDELKGVSKAIAAAGITNILQAGSRIRGNANA